MKLVKLVCPNCGGKVKADPSLKTAECKYCHSEFLIDDEEPTINNYYTYDKTNVRKPDSKRVMLGIIAFFVILSMITIPMLMHLGSSSSSNSGKVQDLPEGKVMKEFVAVALEKDFDEIDQEDLAKIKYVSVRYDKMKQGYDFQYSFENYFKNKADFGDSIKHLLISSEEYNLELNDILSLQALVKLEVGDGIKSDYNQNLSAMKDLQSYKSTDQTNYLQNIETIPNPEKMKDISIFASDDQIEKLMDFKNLESIALYEANSTDKIGDLTKLKKLKSVEVVAYSNENWDLSWLSSMKKLTSLKISDIGGKVDDFTFLYSLNNLDHLDIYSEALREMEFVHNMPKLISLSLENTSLINLEPLRNRTAMSELVVGYNGNLSNLDVISTLTGLTKLKIIDIANVHEVSKTLDLHTLRNLEEVSVDNWCMDTIADLPTIKCLEIDATGELLMDKVATLKGLETLKLRDGNLDNFEALQALPNLKHLILGADVSGYYTGGNYATMFNLPIETLEVYTSSLYLDVSQVQQNATIKKLYFIQGNNNLTKLENGNEIGDSLGIGDFSEILSKMIGVEELVILNGKVNSLEFASMMPNLKFINISDNYVKDLDALKNLKNLKFVICHDNSISNYKVLDKKVLIFK